MKLSLASFIFYSVSLAVVLAFLLLYTPTPFIFISNESDDTKTCDLSNGQWIPDPSELPSPYSNSTCKTIPDSKNCFKNGRKDTAFLNWRWTPQQHQCSLPRFHPDDFLRIVRGKTMTFVGDSVARNHMESLVCLLSQSEAPTHLHTYDDDKNVIWYFPNHNFTLQKLWTKFLVVGEERIVNGSSSGIYDLNLDKIDQNWSDNITASDYIIISTGHWFFRPLYLNQASQLRSCVYCQDPNVTDKGVPFAMRMVIRSAIDHITRSFANRSQAVALWRTFSPAHFENGSWNTGGTCNRTSPSSLDAATLGSTEWELRCIQVEEVRRASNQMKQGNRFGVLDVTKAMLMRPDGHPGSHWDNQWMKGYNDCVHWCLPGPVDVWNDFLFAFLKGFA